MSREGIKPVAISSQRQKYVLLLSALTSKKVLKPDCGKEPGTSKITS